MLLWAFAMQWMLPLDVVAKAVASLNSDTSLATPGHRASAAPAPFETQSEFTRLVPLAVNDVVYSASSGKLYASVPSSAGPGGNSIATIDPLTGSVTNSVFIGSEPNKLALSDDGHTLYVSLDGSFSIRRFDTTTQLAGAEFGIGSDPFFGLYSANDLAVAPGNPNLVAVARAYRGVSPPEAGVAVFDNGVRRTKTGPGHTGGSDYLTFSATETKLYGTGQYSGFTTLNIDATGVTVASTTSQSQGWRIKFQGGLVFGGSGQVINPDTGTLLGTFSGTNTNAFAPDTSVGRAYYLVNEPFSSSTRILKSYEINTFLPQGSATLTGIVGDPTTMIRWGSNGLAFRTTGNQLFIVRTSLIPSADPVPTATPTPAPTASPTPPTFSTFVRQVPLATNDLVFNPTTQSLFASVPSASGSNGNSVTSIDPVAGTVGNSVFVGSEPNKLGLSSDGQTLWVGLDGAGSVRRFETVSQTPSLQFSLGNDYNGPRLASHIDVMPGNPGTIAVNRSYSNAAIYDDGVPRAQASSQSGPSKFGSSSSLYISAGPVQKYSVSPSGLSLVSTTQSNSSGTIDYVNGLVYMSGGGVVDADNQVIKGTFGNLGFGAAMVVDAPNGKVFFLSDVNGWSIRAFDMNTFVPLGSIPIQGITGSPSSLVRWGSNGLAFRTGNKQIFLIQTALVNTSSPIPAATPTPSPTPSPSPAYVPTFLRRVDTPANDVVYSEATGSVYVSVPSVAGANGNSITRIAPQTGTIESSVFVGSEPGLLALSDDGQTLYTNLTGANAIRRFDLPTQTPGPQFSSSPQAVDMDVVPGSPNSIAVSRGTGSFGSPVTVYDNGVARPKSATSGGGVSFYSIGPIEFGASASTLYGYDSFSSGFELVKFSVDATGLTAIEATNNLLQGYINALKFKNGLLYSGTGRVVDPEAKLLKGTFGGLGFSNAFAIDAANGRAFFISTPGSTPILYAFDINTFVPLGSTPLTGIVGTPLHMVRWGTNGLAFNTWSSGTPSANGSRVYLIQSRLVSDAAPVPSGIQFSNSNYGTSENSPTVTLTLTRTGEVSAPASVDYATSDGTGVAGSDYVASNGTVSFAAGQFSRTFTIPLVDDTLYEGSNKTLNVTLSNATGGALLTSPSTAVVTISDNEFKPSISGSFNANVLEGNSGTTNLPFVLNLTNASFQTVTIDYSTGGGTASPTDDYVSTSGTVTFEPGSTSKTINVQVKGDTTDEPNETVTLNLTNPTNASSWPGQLTGTITNDDGPPTIAFSVSALQVSEGVRLATIFVNRAGRTTGTSSVNYATQDGSARQTTDYTVATGTLVFSPGQASRSVKVMINDDGYPESTESVIVTLSNPAGDGATLGSPSVATLFILNNDFDSTLPNPIDNAEFFVRAHYSDFLGRLPDDEGLAYWTAQITQCGTDATCIQDRRVAVSDAFFFEPEYQQTASYLFLLYRAAYGNDQPSANPDTSNVTEAKKLPRYLTFVRDRSQVVGGSNLAESQFAFATAFVQRPEFLAKYPLSLATGPEFVDALLATIQSADGAVLSGLDRNTLVAHFNNGGRAMVLFHLANDYFSGCDRLPGSPAAPCAPAGYGTPVDNRAFIDAEYNRSFVYSQYTGYLRRDADIGGFLFWLNEVNKGAPRNAFLQHAMVCSFITSTEYQRRFSFTVSHSNAECPG